MRTSRGFDACLVPIGIAIWVLFLTRSSWEAAAPPAAAPTAAHSEQAQPAEARPAAAEREAARGEIAPADTIPAQDPDAISPSEMARIPIHGTIVVVDSMGNEHPNESGSIGVTAEGNGGFSGGTIDVTDGCWNGTVFEGTELRISNVVLGNLPAQLAADSFSLPIEGPIALRAQWPDQVILHVRSKDTGSDLDQIVVVRRSEEANHPGVVDDGAVFAQGRSPLWITAQGSTRIGKELIWVGAPGFAWGQMDIDFFAAGEQEIHLERGGDLEIRLSGGSPPNGACLRVWRASQGGTRAGARVSLSNLEPIQLTGLLPGSCRVTIELGDRLGLRRLQDSVRGLTLEEDGALEPTDEDPRLLGAAKVEIVQGERASIAIALREMPKANKVTVDGELFVPAVWDLGSLGLFVEPLDPSPDGEDVIVMISSFGMTCEESAAGKVYRWDLEVYPGRYLFATDNPQYSTTIEVGATDQRVRMEIPPPGQLIVTAMRKGTAEPATGLAEIIWQYGSRGRYEVGRGSQFIASNPETGDFEFLAPLGEIEIFPGSEAFVHTGMVIKVEPGITRVVLEVEEGAADH